MKNAILFLCAGFFLACSPGSSTSDNHQSFRLASDQGYEALSHDQFEKAVTHFTSQKTFAPLSPWPDYNLSCAYAKWQKKAEALNHLSKAVEAGFNDADHMESDPDLENIRSSEEFVNILNRCREKKNQFDRKWKKVFKDEGYNGRTLTSAKAVQNYYQEKFRAAYQSSFQFPPAEHKEMLYRLANEKMDSLKQLDWRNDAEAFHLILRLYARYGHEQDWKEAEPLVRHFLKKFQGTENAAEVRYELADWLNAHNRQEEAKAEFLTLMELHPKSTWTGRSLVIMAVLAEKEGNLDLANEYLDALSSRFPEDEDVNMQKMWRLRHLIYNREGIPSIEENDWNGEKITLDTFRGKVLMIDFWATWCAPCVVEIPHMKKAYDTYNQKGFDIVGVSLDKEMTVEELKDWCTEKGVVWRQIYKNEGWEDTLARRFEVHAIPTIIIIDREGRVHPPARGEALVELIGELVETEA